MARKLTINIHFSVIFTDLISYSLIIEFINFIMLVNISILIGLKLNSFIKKWISYKSSNKIYLLKEEK